LKFVTPAQRYSGIATAVLAQREVVYAKAKAQPAPLVTYDSQSAIDG
jgi:hypothetical protein